MGVSINEGPISGWFYFMENPIKMDDLGATPMGLETSICSWKNATSWIKLETTGNSWKIPCR